MKRNGKVFTVTPQKFRLPACLWSIDRNLMTNMRTIYNHNCCGHDVQEFSVEEKSLRTISFVDSFRGDRLRRERNEKNDGKKIKNDGNSKRSVFETRKLFDTVDRNTGSKKRKKKKKRKNLKKRIREYNRRYGIKFQSKNARVPNLATELRSFERKFTIFKVILQFLQFCVYTATPGYSPNDRVQLMPASNGPAFLQNHKWKIKN